MLQKIIKNPSLMYLISRYFTYLVHFVNSILIAKYLGPYYLGVWGFLYLVINYVSQLNLGISHSVNLILSTNKEKEQYVRKIVGNSVMMVGILSLFIITFFLLSFLLEVPIGQKYDAYKYIAPIVLIGVLMHFNALFSNIFRVYGKIYEIIISQSLYPFLLLLVLPFFRGEQLLWGSIIVHCIAILIAFFVFVFKTPINLFPIFDTQLMRYIQTRGWYLFIYNVSFYFILISSRTFISQYYSVEEFGYFTFSYQFASAVLLLLDSISFLIFPKMLNRFANQGLEQVRNLLSYIRGGYIFSCHFLVHCVILFFPLFIYLFPKYESSLNVFRLIALTVVVYTNAFGYQGLLMARGKEKQIAGIALGALFLNLVACYVLIDVLRIQFEHAILGTLLTYFIYVYILSKMGRRLLKIEDDFLSTFKDVFSYNVIIPFIASFLFSILKLSNLFFVLPLLLLLLLNIRIILDAKNIVIKIINNPNIVNI